MAFSLQVVLFLCPFPQLLLQDCGARGLRVVQLHLLSLPYHEGNAARAGDERVVPPHMHIAGLPIGGCAEGDTWASGFESGLGVAWLRDPARPQLIPSGAPVMYVPQH